MKDNLKLDRKPLLREVGVFILASLLFLPLYAQKDYTSKVKNTAEAWGGTGTYVAGSVSCVDYFSSTHFYHNTFSQTVSGLPVGVYEAEVYFNASCTGSAGSLCSDGTTGRTHLFLNDAEVDVPIYNYSAKTLSSPTLYSVKDIHVSDGTLHIGARNDREGANWHIIRVKSLKYIGPDVRSLYDAQFPLIRQARQALAASTCPNYRERLQSAIEASLVASAYDSQETLQTLYDDIVTAITESEAFEASKADALKKMMLPLETFQSVWNNGECTASTEMWNALIPAVEKVCLAKDSECDIDAMDDARQSLVDALAMEPVAYTIVFNGDIEGLKNLIVKYKGYTYTTTLETANLDPAGLTATAVNGYDYTITVTGTTITVTYIKHSVVRRSQLYTVSCPRGAWKYNNGMAVAGSPSAGDVNQLFAFYDFNGKTYLWSEGARQFLDNNGKAVDFTAASPITWVEEDAGTKARFWFTDAADKNINIDGYNNLLIDAWDYADEGNKMTLNAVEGFDAEAVLALIATQIGSITLIDGDTYNSANATDYGIVNYDRSFTNLNWQALYVPFVIKYDEWRSDYDIAEIEKFIEYDDDADGKLDRICLVVKKKASGSTKANHPYFIRPKRTGIHSLVLLNKTLEAATNASITIRGEKNLYTFTGTYAIVGDMHDSGYYTLVSGSLRTANNNSVTLSPQRWYMTVTSRSGGAALTDIQSIPVWTEGEDYITGLDESPAPASKPSTVFDITGRVITPPSVPRGVSIVNGRKVIR